MIYHREYIFMHSETAHLAMATINTYEFLGAYKSTLESRYGRMFTGFSNDIEKMLKSMFKAAKANNLELIDKTNYGYMGETIDG